MEIKATHVWLIRGEISLAGGSIRVNVSTVNLNVFWREIMEHKVRVSKIA